MADRTVTVNLQARVSGYIAQMQAAGRATADVGKSGSKTAQQAGLLSPKLLGVGVAAATMTAMAVKKFADFDAAMSEVRAATGETADGMDALTIAAKKAGGATMFSAKEAAEGITNLAKAGVSTADILSGGLDGALDLAAAGSMDVADAAETAAAALVTFNLRGTDMSHVADLLAAGAGKAMGEVSDLGMALKQAGVIAANTGLSIEETTAALSAMASRGILGSDAGTSLKSFLQRLVPESKKAANAMESIGLAAYDAQGNFVGLEAVAGQLRKGLARLTQEERDTALKTIFGSDAVRAATVLYAEGADGVQEWTNAVNDAGYAAEYASTLTDNLKGDIERLTGALDTQFVSAGANGDGGIRRIIQALTELIDKANELEAWGAQQSGGRTPAWYDMFKKGEEPIAFWRDRDAEKAASEMGPAIAAARYSDALDDTKRRAGMAGKAVDDIADAMLQAAEAADAAARAQQAANKAYLESIEVALRAVDSQINYEAAVDDTRKTLKENGRTHDLNTEKGRENTAAINDMTRAAAGVVVAMIEQGDEQEEVAAKADEMADAVYKAARQAGFSKKEAKEYADQLRDVPDTVETEYETKGVAAAKRAAQDLIDLIGEVPRNVTTRWSVRKTGDTVIPESSGLSSGKRVRRHSGGEVPGAGNVPVTAQGGEYVINRAAYNANRDLVRAINNGTQFGGSGLSIGAINVTETGSRVRVSVLDALAESAYRSGAVR